MLDGLLGRGFSSKCKSLIKATRARIEVVRKRAEVKQRFLKEDLAKLLSNGLDINAYGRTEEFLAGLNLLLCYDFIEQTCEFIVKQLSRIEKQGECPEECREAVASLMFAAARFSDFPELRDLRNIFQQRYGNSLEAFVDRKFCEKLSVVPLAQAKKLQVLHDITSEFSIKWDSKGFEQRIGSPSALVQIDVQKADVKQRYGLLDAKCGIQSSVERNVMRRGNSNDRIAGSQETVKQAHKPPLKKGESSSQGGDFLFHGRQTSMDDEHSYAVERYDEELKQVKTEKSSHRKMQNNIDVGSVRQSNGVSNSRKGENCGAFTGNMHSYPAVKSDAEVMNVRLSNSSHRKDLDNGHIGYMRHNNGICNSGKGENSEAFSYEKGEYASNFGENLGKNDDVFTKALGSIKRGLEEESDGLKSCTNYALLPPYVEPKDVIGLPPPYTKPKEDKRRASRVSDHVGSDSEHSINLPACNRSDAAGQACTEPDENVHEEQFIESAKVRSYRHEKEFGHQDDKVSIPKPRSTRRKHHKSSSGNDIVGSGEDGDVKRRSSSRRKDHSRKGLQMIFDEEHHRNNEEEMLMDELLIHYCKKPSSYDGGKLKKKMQAQSSHHIAHDAHDASKMVPVPNRSISLPREPVASPEPKKAFNRSNTFQPDNQAPHVHPKLPDYDDLAERFAALKGR